MRSIFRLRVIGATLFAFALLAAACGDSDGSGGDANIPDGPTITVTSFNFNESQILAEIYAQALEDSGYPVDRQLNLGAREVVLPALGDGEVDLVPEYIGTMLTFLGGTATSDSESTHAALVELASGENIAVAGFTPAQDKNGLVVTSDFAEETGITKTSELAERDDLVFGGPPECPNREFCLIGLQDVYGWTPAEFKPLDVGGPLTVAALDGGEIDVALLFTSDGIIAARNFVLLEDDQGLQPAENVAPALSSEVADVYGQDLIDRLDEVSAAISQVALTEMNRRAGVDQDDPADIAADWLTENGFIG